jgi:hypothetical protein
MISTAPFDDCPRCWYLLRGLPSAHRCPECGLAYDENSAVFRSKHPWKTCIGLLLLELLLLHALLPLWGFLFALFTPLAALLLLFAVLIGLPVATVLFVFRAHRRGRFAAITPSGLIVRNLGDEAFVEWDALTHVAVYDSPPWVQRIGSEERISLRGLFDDRTEARVFDRAMAFARRLYIRSPNDGPDSVDGAMAAMILAEIGRDAALRAHRRRVNRATVLGVALIAAATFMLTATLFFPGVSDSNLVIKLGLGFCGAGAIIAMIGQWWGDRPPRTAKGNVQDKVT